jgi:hypothetical protein
MGRMVLIALMAFCGLLFLGEEKASAIPYTFSHRAKTRSHID